MTAVAPPPTSGKFRERLMVDFDVRRFLDAHPDVVKTNLARTLGLSVTAIKFWMGRKATTLSGYKALVMAVDPSAAAECELGLLVFEHDRVQVVTPQMAALASAYDAKRAGAKIALKDGSGFYQIPKERALSLPAPAAPDKDPAVVAAIAPKPRSDEERDLFNLTDEFLQQQDVLLEVLSRVTAERNQQFVELAKLRRTLADKDAVIEAQAARITTLQQTNKEWEQLVEQGAERVGTFTGREIADDVIDRMAELFKVRGASHLAVELERLNPKRAGRLSS